MLSRFFLSSGRPWLRFEEKEITLSASWKTTRILLGISSALSMTFVVFNSFSILFLSSYKNSLDLDNSASPAFPRDLIFYAAYLRRVSNYPTIKLDENIFFNLFGIFDFLVISSAEAFAFSA